MFELSEIRPEDVDTLNGLPLVPNAELLFDAFRALLIWSDERPEMWDGHMWPCLQRLLRFRTNLIRGIDNTREEARLWESSSSLFPLWPGF